MFHTWKHSQPPESERDDGSQPQPKKRTNVAQACDRCRKRKVACNGEHPCESCKWAHKVNACHYSPPLERRRHAKRKTSNQTTESSDEYRAVVERLFPASDVDQLKSLPRDNLLELASNTSPDQVLFESPVNLILDQQQAEISPEATNLEELQPMPESDSDSANSQDASVEGVTDEVNALSLSVNRSTSYLGISSVAVMLRVILLLDPEAETFFSEPPHATVPKTPLAPEKIAPVRQTIDDAPSPWTEIPLINAYFNYIHPLAPVLHEIEFRDTYITKTRTDHRWRLLLNTVLALGSVVDATTQHEHGHQLYWQRAREFLTIETLGVAHIETVQALSLLGGLYLHYLQQPMLADSIMGACMRLATALGLHRDYPTSSDASKSVRSMEIRRRIWWSIFILESWAGYGLGRPSMGRLSQSTTAKAPHAPIEPSEFLQPLMQENIKFCVITTRIQDALAHSPIIMETERRALDNALTDWYREANKNASMSESSSEAPHGVRVIQNVLRWRCLLCRILIYRPVMLWAATGRLVFSRLPEEKSNAIRVCREATKELINDIVTTWQDPQPSSFSGWTATWLLYQALMVPLLHLFADTTDSEINDQNRILVETGLSALEELKHWSPTATRSREVVRRIHAASERRNSRWHEDLETGDRGPKQFAHSFQAVPHGSTAPMAAEAAYPVSSEDMLHDEVFVNLNWGNDWVEDTFSSQGHPFAWHESAMGMDHDNQDMYHHYQGGTAEMQQQTGNGGERFFETATPHGVESPLGD